MDLARVWLGTLAILAVLCGARMQAQQDGGGDIDGPGGDLLQSIVVPHTQHAPFSITLNAEWARALTNGGTYTTVNSRPIKRDSEGRIYQERWLMAPKGSRMPPRMSWIQIADPVAKLYWMCSPGQKVCEMDAFEPRQTKFDPAMFKPGAVPGRGVQTRDDLGEQSFLGVRVHWYRDTTTLNPGVMGNDTAMSTVREYRFSTELGINLTSTVISPRLGTQTFTVTEISTTEPDAHYFKPPEGFRIVDLRKVRKEAN